MSGQKVAFKTVCSGSKRIDDAFGRGICFTYQGESVEGPQLTRELKLSFYEAFPSTVLVSAVYHNASGEEVAVDGWSLCDLQVRAAEPDPCFWSFQGQSTSAREDWILPVDDEFYQRNYMGMNPAGDHVDYGGGVPVVCLWRRDAGVIIGHLEPTPQIVSLPVDKKAEDDFATISVVKEYDEPLALAEPRSPAL